MNTKYSIAVCLIILLNLMPCCCHAAEPTGDGTSLYLGMPIESVETIWGQPAGNDSYTGTLRWYVKDGHTLICGYSWCDVQRGVWHNGRHDDDVWGLAEWVEFDSHRKQVAGTIPMSETVWKAAWQLLVGMSRNTITCPRMNNQWLGSMMLAAAPQFLQRSPETAGSLSRTSSLSQLPALGSPPQKSSFRSFL